MKEESITIQQLHHYISGAQVQGTSGRFGDVYNPALGELIRRVAFADEGELLLGPLGRAQGREQIRTMMGRALEGVTGNSFHVIANPLVDLDPEGDRASSEVTWAVVARAQDGSPQLTMYGRHIDQLIRERGRWRFLRREGHIDLPSSYPGN